MGSRGGRRLLGLVENVLMFVEESFSGTDRACTQAARVFKNELGEVVPQGQAPVDGPFACEFGNLGIDSGTELCLSHTRMVTDVTGW